MVTNPTRLYFLDNLRVVLTVLVIAHHVGQAYGPTGGWWPIMEVARAAVLGPFFTVNRSFFMSLFFMISGYFAAMSCEAKGPKAFMSSRLLRLGIPVLVFGLIMLPLQIFVFDPGAPWPGFDVGHLWFLDHLLIFSGGYALWVALRRNRPAAAEGKASPPGYLPILGLALALAVVSAVVRIWFPIDRWILVLGFIRTAFADVPRDLAFFILGLVAYRRQWFLTFPRKAGRVWLAVGVTAGALWYVYLLALRAVYPIDGVALGVMYPIWEMLVCFGMCIGLTVLFRDGLNVQSRLLEALGASQYKANLTGKAEPP